MILHGLILALFFAGTLLPYGWSKFDNPTKATFLYIFGGVLILLVATGWRRLKNIEETGKIKKWIVVACVWSGLVWVAWVASPIRNFGLSEVAVLIGGAGIGGMAMAWSEKEKKYGIYMLLGMGWISVIIGWGQYLVRSESRIAGPFFELGQKAHYFPNAFALFLLMIWPLALMVGKKWMRIVLLAGFLSAIALTFSRAAWIAAGLQILCLTAYHIQKNTKEDMKKKKIWQSVLAVMLLTIIIIGALHGARSMLYPAQTNSFAQKAVFAGTEKETSVLERAQFMHGTMTLIAGHPWLGSGPFSFRYIYPAIQSDFLALSDHPHNWYLKIALEEGIPAAVLFIVLLVLILIPAIRDVMKNPKNLPLLLAILGALVHNLVDYNMNFFATQLLFWLLLGWLANTNAKVSERASDSTSVNTSAHRAKSWSHLFAALILILPVSIILLREGALSIAHAEKTSLLFPRTWFLDETYRTLAGHMPEQLDPSSSQWQRAYDSLQEAIKRNSYDAQAINLEGHFFASAKKYHPLALNTFAAAVTLDPANAFGYYIDYVRLAQQEGKISTQTYVSITKKATALLSAYPEKVEKNIHYTAQSRNLPQAIALARLIHRDDLAEKILTAASKYQSGTLTKGE